MKEVTGHILDAVHKYQETSTDQKMHLSEIIQGDVEPIKLSQVQSMEVVEAPKTISNEDKFKLPKFVLPVNVKNDIESKECKRNEKFNEVHDVLETAIKAIGSHKAKVTVQVELLH